MPPVPLGISLFNNPTQSHQSVDEIGRIQVNYKCRWYKTRSSVRVRVEHVFGAQSNDMGGTLVRSIGLIRAKAHIGLKNLSYNMRRLVQLEQNTAYSRATS